jgi:hypothetical protein
VWIRLIRKLADWLDGIDVSDRRVGELFDLPIHDAQLLIAEAWAEPYGALAVAPFGAPAPPIVDDKDRVEAAVARLRQLREQQHRLRHATVERRRIEDRIRDELRDERAITIRGGRKIS